MKNKLNKLLTFVFTIAFLMMSTVTTSVYAGPMFDPITPVALGEGDGAGGDGGGLIHKPNPTPIGGIEDMVKPIVTMIKQTGTAVAAGMLIYVGIKYVMASANEKADLKNSSIRYVIGALILLSVVQAFDIVKALVLEIEAMAS